ncbi:hypothetical protein evm_004054 [Chilo suppressalis]|nr:hypothetical protein evm_004054 [Chilo suppressalis]
MSINSIYETAYKGDFNQVKVKVDADKSLVITPDENNRHLIHWAALGGNENLVDYLLDKGSPINSVDDSNSNPLILAASAGRYEAVRLLIGRGANVNQKTKRGQSALHYACSKGHIEVAKLLLEAGANINDTDILNATPLHRAAAQGRSNIVELLLSNPTLNLDLADSTGSTALHLACEEEREPVACMLLKSGANSEIMNKEKNVPLDLCSPQLRKKLNSLIE